MEEMIPVGAGVVLGFAIASLIRARVRPWALGVGSVLLGAMSSWINGELAISWVYLLIDIAQVFAAGGVIWFLAARWKRLVRPWLRPSV